MDAALLREFIEYGGRRAPSVLDHGCPLAIEAARVRATSFDIERAIFAWQVHLDYRITPPFWERAV